METDKAYYIGTNSHSFRQGEPAEIIGVVTYYPDLMGEPRVCFHLRYGDGFEDYSPISDKQNYIILTADKIKNSYSVKERIDLTS